MSEVQNSTPNLVLLLQMGSLVESFIECFFFFPDWAAHRKD